MNQFWFPDCHNWLPWLQRLELDHVQMGGRWVFWAAPNPTALARAGIQISLFHFHQWQESCSADSASGLLRVGRRACTCHGTPLIHQLFCLFQAAAGDREWGRCEQGEERQRLSPKLFQKCGIALLAGLRRSWLRRLAAIHCYIRDSHSGLPLQSVQENKENNLLNLSEFRVRCTAQSRLIRQVPWRLALGCASF